VYYEKADYDACVADCDAAVERGRELRADYALIGRALARKVRLGLLKRRASAGRLV
jgi:stress-induced-phosphoprotein 1